MIFGRLCSPRLVLLGPLLSPMRHTSESLVVTAMIDELAGRTSSNRLIRSSKQQSKQEKFGYKRPTKCKA